MSTIAERLPSGIGEERNASEVSPSPGRKSDSARRLDIALTLFRVVLGTVFMVHGAQKVFVFGLGGVTGAFAGMGIPLAAIVGPLVAFAELLGGLALIVGALTRLASAAVAAVMLGALFTVHLPAGFFLPDGFEFVLTLFAGAMIFVLTGAGPYSADALWRRRKA